MKLSTEIEVNPGPAALFVAEFVLEKWGEQGNVSKGYWGLHLAWWLLKDWRKFLWCREWSPGKESGWSLYTTRLLGFEITWERRRR
jgi:hypothetical protein